MWIIEWLLEDIFNLVQKKITAENAMYIEAVAAFVLGYFGIILNMHVLAFIFLLNVDFIYHSRSKQNYYPKYKNKRVQNFNLAYEASKKVLIFLIFFGEVFGLSVSFLILFFSFTRLIFTLMTVGVMFFEEKSFSHKAFLLLSSIVSLISLVLYVNAFGLLDYLAFPGMFELACICICCIAFDFLAFDDKGQSILEGAFKLKNWDKFLFAFVVQASFLVFLCFWGHPELFTLLFGLPTLQYISCVILLVPLIYVENVLIEYLFTVLPLLWSKGSGMMMKIGCCFLSVLLFGLLQMGSFTLLGILHCFAITLPTSVTLLTITFYSGGVEYSLGLRYAIALLSLILFPGAISGSLVASVSLMQVCWAFLDASLSISGPVLLVFFYEMTYYKGWAYGSNVIEKEAIYKGWAYGSNVIEKEAMKIYLNPFKDYCKKSNLKVIGAHGYQLFYDILTGLNISSENGWNVFYRQASLVFHPDQGGEGEHFKSLNGIKDKVNTAGNYTTCGILKIIEGLAPAVGGSHDDEQISKYFSQ